MKKCDYISCRNRTAACEKISINPNRKPICYKK